MLTFIFASGFFLGGYFTKLSPFIERRFGIGIKRLFLILCLILLAITITVVIMGDMRIGMFS